MVSHSGCSHPATRSARATCRRQRAAAASNEAKSAAKVAAKAPSTNRKRVKATNGHVCSPTELQALRNIAGRDCPATKSNVTCRAIRDKGFAYWNEHHHVWMLTAAGQELLGKREAGRMVVAAKDLRAGDVMELPFQRTATIQGTPKVGRLFVSFRTEHGPTRMELDHETLIRREVTS